MRINKNIIIDRDSNGKLQAIDMLKPSNFHGHARDKEMMQAVCRDLMQWVKYLLLMPNTGPIDTVDKVLRYYDELVAIRDALGLKTELIMTVYLTDKLTAEMVKQLAQLPFKVYVKYYPPHPGATTGAGLGIPLPDVPMDTWRAMTDHDIWLLGHFESVYDKDGRMIDMIDREAYFMENEFLPFREKVPDLKINAEHISTRQAIANVKADSSGNTTCGITPHHALICLDDLLTKSWANHGKCMPIPKHRDDMDATREFMTSGDWRTQAGDDSAPHPSKKKVGEFWSPDVACGCWLPHALALYAVAFEMENALDDRFVDFMCFNGPDQRGLRRPRPHERIRIIAETEHDVPEPLQVPAIDDVVIPLGWTEDADRMRVGLALALEHELTA